MGENTATWKGQDRQWAWVAFNGWLEFGDNTMSDERREFWINNAHIIIMMCMEQDRGEHTIPTPCYE